MYPYKECNVVAVRPTNSNSHYKHTSFNSISLIEYKTCESKNDKNELKPPRTERFGESDKERNKPRKNANKKVLWAYEMIRNRNKKIYIIQKQFCMRVQCFEYLTLNETNSGFSQKSTANKHKKGLDKV